MNLAKYYWTGYRDEMIATGVVFCVAACGSFFILANSGLLPKISLSVEPASDEQVLGEQDEGGSDLVAVSPTPTATLGPTIEPTPSGNPSASTSATPNPGVTAVATPTTVFVSGGKTFDEEKYRLTINSLRMDINALARTRVFRLDAVLANKSVTEGLHNRLAVSIVRDGRVMIESVPLSVSESKTVMPGQQLTYTASLSLIEGTDVKSVFYKPGTGGANDVEFAVLP